MHILIHLKLYQRTTTFSWVPAFFPPAAENNVIKCHLLIQPLTTPWRRGIPIMKTNKRLLSRVAYYMNVCKDAMVTTGTNTGYIFHRMVILHAMNSFSNALHWLYMALKHACFTHCRLVLSNCQSRTKRRQCAMAYLANIYALTFIISMLMFCFVFDLIYTFVLEWGHQANSLHSFIFLMFSIVKSHVNYWISRWYLTCFTASQLWWQLSKIKMILGI